MCLIAELLNRSGRFLAMTRVFCTSILFDGEEGMQIAVRHNRDKSTPGLSCSGGD